MYLVEIILPLNDNEGKPQGHELMSTVAAELKDKFGCLTAHARAQGLWQKGNDEIVIYEVMADKLDKSWWKKYRKILEKRFQQEQVIVRAKKMKLL